jgi:hypothetical protein
MTRRVDPLSLGAALVALAMAWVYLTVVQGQGNDPAAWVVVVLVGAGLGAGYGGIRGTPARRLVLGTCAFALAVLGLLAILTVGLPILVAAGLCVLGALRGPVAEPAQGSAVA